MKIIDAGTQVLDDKDVLKFIKEKRAQHAEQDAYTKAHSQPTPSRPANYLQALQQHQEHLEQPERPFRDNARYDDDEIYPRNLIDRLGARVQLVKPEYLMIVNHRPYLRELLSPMLEDMDSRFDEDTQQWIVDTVAEVLGKPAPMAQRADGPADGGPDDARMTG